MLRILAVCVLVSGCASSYKVTAGSARGLDALANALAATDAKVPKAARVPAYLKARDIAADAIVGAAALLPVGCASSLSSAAAAALTAAPVAFGAFSAMVPPPTRGALDPAVEAALIQAGFAAAGPLFSGIAAIVTSAQAADAQAQADCIAAVAQAQADAAGLKGKLQADDQVAP